MATMDRHPVLACLLALVLLVSTGCVERKLLLRSEPPGALVSLNGEPWLPGTTPLEVPFTHYGTYAVLMTLEDHRPLEAEADVSAPWWAWPPFDLVTELLLPTTIRDHREFDFTLEPLPPRRPLEESRVRYGEMLERAESLRRRVNEGDPAEVR